MDTIAIHIGQLHLGDGKAHRRAAPQLAVVAAAIADDEGLVGALARLVLAPEDDEHLVAPVVVGIAQGHIDDLPRFGAAPHLNIILVDCDLIAFEAYVFWDAVAREIDVALIEHAAGQFGRLGGCEALAILACAGEAYDVGEGSIWRGGTAG